MYFIRSFFHPTYLTYRRRAYVAALAAIEEGLPRGWVSRTSLLGRKYYFDHFTWATSSEKPGTRALYEPLLFPHADQRVAVIVPASQLESPLECLILPKAMPRTIEEIDWLSIEPCRTLLRLLNIWVASPSRFGMLRSVQDQKSLYLEFGLCCDALSYVWGDATITERITLNGQIRDVTANLADALRQLRTDAESQPIMIWADAICVNQDDLEERASQVVLMPYIYPAAPNVHIWLGRLNPSMELAMQMFGTLLCNIREGKYVDYDDSSGETAAVLTSAENTDAFFQEGLSLAAASSLSYWRRKWIVQEVCLAHILTVHCGTKRLPQMKQTEFLRLLLELSRLSSQWLKSYSHFYKRLAAPVSTRHRGSADIFEALSAPDPYLKFTQAAWARTLKPQPAENGHMLSVVLLQLREARAKEPLDGVYAYLAMFRHILVQTPDYTLPPRKVFSDTTVKLVRASKSLALLAQACFTSGSDRLLPSWALDFAKEAPVVMPQVVLHDNYDACASVKAGIIYMESEGAIITRATFIDAIAAIGPNFTETESLKADYATIIHKCLKAWRAFASTHDCENGPDRLFRLLAIGTNVREEEIDLFVHEVRDWLERVQFDPIAYRTLVLQILPTAPGATLFVTQSGRFGFIHKGSDISVGADVVVLAGSPVPFCVEKRAPNCLVCGEAPAGISDIRRACKSGSVDCIPGIHCIDLDQPDSKGNGGFVLALKGPCLIDGGVMSGQAIKDEARKQFNDEGRVDQLFEQLVIV